MIEENEVEAALSLMAPGFRRKTSTFDSVPGAVGLYARIVLIEEKLDSICSLIYQLHGVVI